jgi:hypothetical protein
LLSFSNVLVNNPSQDGATNFTQSETANVVFGNTILVDYNDSDHLTPTLPFPTNEQVASWSISTNGGQTFADMGPLPPNPNGTFGDPMLARDQTSGTIYFASLGYKPPGVEVVRSFDGGATLQAPVNAAPGFPNTDFLDKEWMAVDNFPGPGQGNVYMAYKDFVGTFSNVTGSNGIFLTRSTDGGATWGPSGGTFLGGGSVQGANVAVGPDHAVYVFWVENKRTFLPGHWDIVMRKSGDFGVTFGPPVTVAELRTNGPNGDLGLTDNSARTFRTNAFPQAAVNPVTGDIYVVFDDQPNGSADKADIYFTESSNGGQSWSNRLRVNDDATNNDQWQPTLAVTPDGSHLGIFWYDRRLDPANNLIDRFGVIGAVSGHIVTFAPNFRITDVSFPPVFGVDPTAPPNYMGDYDTASADNHFFYTTWGDNRLPDANNSSILNQPDVRFAKMPVPAIEGALASATSTVGTALVARAFQRHSLVPGLMVVPFSLPETSAPSVASSSETIRQTSRDNSSPAISHILATQHRIGVVLFRPSAGPLTFTDEGEAGGLWDILDGSFWEETDLPFLRKELQ